jgi:phosphoglycolate phosphatase-like HAD superfamily hydrolase
MDVEQSSVKCSDSALLGSEGLRRGCSSQENAGFVATAFHSGDSALTLQKMMQQVSCKRTLLSIPLRVARNPGQLLLLLIAWLMVANPAAAQESLASWNDGPAKKSLLEFVERVTQEGSADFVPQPERIAVFDNDGTLWPENPMPFQLAFALDRVQAKAAVDQQLAADPMVQAAIAGDFAKLLEGPRHEGLLRIVALTHAGMTVEQFEADVRAWLKTAKHPRFSQPYTALTYRPMQEVLTLLRSHGFKTFIVSGGGADFMRVWSEEVYGIPPEQVVGSTSRTKWELRDGIPQLVKTLDHLFIDDKEGKPVGIQQFIGRRPIACFGNSDGDLAMLQYTTIGNSRPSFGMIVHHTDPQREYAYDAMPKSSGKLVEAIEEAGKRGWTVVDMRNDWRTVFGP